MPGLSKEFFWKGWGPGTGFLIRPGADGAFMGGRDRYAGIDGFRSR